MITNETILRVSGTGILQDNTPLVSVVIPCYNHAHRLGRAIKSILAQSYCHYEIIVIDDGSRDNTREVAAQFESVQYYYQPNSGLVASRNTGIEKSQGEFIVFLDADDWLCQEALETNLRFLQQDPDLVFVSGSYLEETDQGVFKIVPKPAERDHYLRFLEDNYVGMFATTMFRRKIFDKVRFNLKLRACEDYDLFLRISKNYKVKHHHHAIAAYVMHGENMSGNYPLMLDSALTVLVSQRNLLTTKAEKVSYRKGVNTWVSYYCGMQYVKILKRKDMFSQSTPHEFRILFQYRPDLIGKLLLQNSVRMTRKFIKSIVPKSILQKIKPGVTVNLGDLNRTAPISTEFGYDRGGPVDRYYIENFLKDNAHLIRGRVLEIGDNEYTLRFGKEHVRRSEILHVDDSNPYATIIGDLSNASHIPDDSFDCIVLTQTLHLIYDYKKAIETCFRILKPGGALLLTVPGISHIDQGEWGKTWFWSFTRASLEKILLEVFATEHVSIRNYGNVLAATAFLYGLGLPEVDLSKIDQTDNHYQLIISACAIK